jgi:Bacterial extracellular solute-binding protein
VIFKVKLFNNHNKALKIMTFIYKILDWISIHKKISLLIGLLVFFLAFLLILSTLLDSSKKGVEQGKKALQGSDYSVDAVWWVENADPKSSTAYANLITKFKASGYKNFNASIVEKNTSLKFTQDFINNPNAQPDIMTISDELIPFYQKYSMPVSYYKGTELANYLDRSVNLIKTNTVVSTEVYATPMSVDSLQLYVNKNLLSKLSKPAIAENWETLRSQYQEFPTSEGKNLIALGKDSSINDNYTDIVGAMLLQKKQLLQSSDTFIDPNVGKDIIDFYFQFERNYSGNTKAIDSFKEGKSLYYIDYLSAKDKIKEQSPNLDFKIAKLPTFAGFDNISHAKFQATMINQNSKNNLDKKKVMEDFMYFLGSESSRQEFANETDLPSVSKEIVGKQYDNFNGLDEGSREFYRQALIAKAIIPTCGVLYKENWDLLIKKYQITSVQLRESIWPEYSPAIQNNLNPSSTCFPFKLVN